jgi:rfaE bifunctional protein kinase chain/domain
MKRVFISGNFNILHPGHLRLLRFAKEYGEFLIVGVNSDRIAGTDAYLSEDLRLESIRSSNFVNESFLIDDPIEAILDRIRPDIVIKGKEYEGAYNLEKDVVESYGGRLIFSSGEMAYSSAELLQKELQLNNFEQIRIPNQYLNRHNISRKSLISIVNKFSELSVCVIGDLIIDEYIDCVPLGMSQEETTIVVTPIDQAKYIGGAGIVAAHAAGLGATANFLSISGNDINREFALNELNKANVSTMILVDDTRPTTLKQRFRSKGKSLLRVSQLHQSAISIELQNKLFEELQIKFKKLKPNILIISDFNYGCLPQNLVERIIALANTFKILVIADSQSSSQSGNIARFGAVGLLTPTEHEARLALRNRDDGLIVLAEQLHRVSGAKNILLKLGEDGLLVHTRGSSDDSWETDKIEALNLSPKDVAGAGDSLLVVSGLVLALGGSIWEASVLGSLAAAIQISRIGNIPMLPQDLLNPLNK